MEIRDIEIFLTLAQELHFGRTAERLHVSPARVTQSVKKQERRIGALLFDRTTRAVRLTPAGQQLYRELDAGYRQIMDGIETVSAAARGISGTLTLGCMGPHPWAVADAIELFRTRHPGAEVQIREIQPPAPLEAVRAGDVDVSLVWLPVDGADLTVGPLVHTAPVLLMLSAEHALAARQSIGLEDLGDCVIIAGQSISETMDAAFNPLRTPSGRPIRRGPRAATWHEILHLVASGQGAAGVSAEAADFYPWPSLAFVPIQDAPACRWALVWRTAAETPMIAAFARAAADAISARPNRNPSKADVHADVST
ncbi:LysR family transcriptional regulator [Streptosporangium nondiastaticum]|uniref:LysR family transcriptional regulator n=1 Tax=Streptosporangium nondiastaticum TaxID=35764 RepID=A0A9X7PFE2_9ACTN|nr:LysR family transcriptional regulator [Streptosporangium nondiastaticum]